MKRNGYIDIIKFLFAIIIAEFHLNSGLFPGGRLAVEGFFMITGFLMLKSAEQKKDLEKNIGCSSLNFLKRKYEALFYTLFPSVVLSFIVISVYRETLFVEAIKRIPLLIFEIIPLNSLGFNGEYVIGVSWYLSSMFVALAVLYPLSIKFKQIFTLIICPLIVCLGYGTLAHFYGNLAVNYQYLPNTIFNTGIIRGFAGCALGCILYEVSRCLKKKNLTVFGRSIFTFLEIGLITYFLCIIHYKPKSSYDFVLIFVLFTFLLIGICGLSYTSRFLNPKWTKFFGTSSTLVVLTHYCWTPFFKKEFGDGYQNTSKVFWYVAAVVVSCILVYIQSVLLKFILTRKHKLIIFSNCCSEE
ncbi:MAG: acyltransferase [Clostridia bacterium]|nr:acyltransferase [Clostridia bacterium]